ncbi:DUF2642 domain-containing protein [Lysinibacillus sp. NPDC096418]|uniref:DUF2642 domain-containing protein n=1 Tax=Lysinibacillus sp. NPDC096418 TaxID=3364138 RepID=UPI00382E5EAF
MVQNLNKETVRLDISGKKVLKGIIVDSGIDMIVLYNGYDYYYIPNSHIHELKMDDYEEDSIVIPTKKPDIVLNNNKDDLTLEKVLTRAMGIYCEIYVTGNQALHGYISNIMDDYFVFQSPLYKTIYIKIEHLKWLIPYNDHQFPYKLSAAEFPVQPFNESLSKTFETQIDSLKGKLVIFNQGEKSNYIGRMNNVKGQIVELQTARTSPIFLNLLHLKTVYQA